MVADRTVSVTLRANVAGFAASMGAAKQSVSGLSKEFASAARTNAADMQMVGQSMAAVGAATLAGMGMAVKSAVDFESSFAGVRKTVDASEPEFAALADGFRGLATEIPASVHEINAVGEAAGQLGIKKENILGFTRTMVDLGVATNLSADEAATALARFANVTGMAQEDFGRLGSVIVDLGNNFATTESEIVGFGSRLAGAGTQIGLTEGEILAIGTALSSVGISAEAGGTAFSKVMINIAQEVETGGDKLAKFAEVAGMTTEQFATAWKDDAAGALTAFITGLGEVDAAGGNTFQVLEDLGVTEQRMRDALLRSAGASGVLTDALDLQASAWSDNTALSKEAEQRYATLASQMKIARNKINDAAISIGQVLAPAVAGAVGVVGDLAGAFSGLPEPIQASVAVMGSVGGLALTAAGGFLMLAPRIVATKDAMSALATTMPNTTAGLSAVKGFLMGPWGAALAAGAVALGAYAVAQQKVKEEIETVRATLDDQTGAITANTKEWVTSKLEAQGVLEAAQQLGLDLPLVTEAALGNVDAQAQLNEQLAGLQGGFDETATATSALTNFLGIGNKELYNYESNALLVSEAVGLTGGVIDQAKDSQDRQNASLKDGVIAYGGSEEASQAYSDRLQGQADAYLTAQANAAGLFSHLSDLADMHAAAAEMADIQRQAISDLADEQRAAVDPVFAMNRALADVEAAQEAYNDAVDEYGPKSKEAESASFDLASAVSGAEQAALDGDLSFGAFSAKLDDWVAQGRITADQASTIRARVSDLRDEANAYEGSYWADIQAETATAQARLAEVRAAIGRIPRSINSTVTITYLQRGQRSVNIPGRGRYLMHSGGVVGDTRKFHTGEQRTDEVPAMLQRGEFVVNEEATSKYGDLLKAINEGRGSAVPARPSGPAGGGGGNAQDLVAALSGMQWKLDIDPRGVATVTAKGNRQLAAFGGTP